MTRLDVIKAAAAALASPLPVPSALPTGRPSLSLYHARDVAASDLPLAPDRLLHVKNVQVVVETGWDEIAAANAAIDAARAIPHEGTAPLDVRWGLRFSTATGRFVHSVYCDANARMGQVDGRPVTFDDGAALLAYLTKTLGAASNG